MDMQIHHSLGQNAVPPDPATETARFGRTRDGK